MNNKFEAVIGLEIHVQLNSNLKLFCRNSNLPLNDQPNTRVNQISLGHPGSLPFLNLTAVKLAIKMGFICQCQIAPMIKFDRKNYFYPDLPKNYQITQQNLPIGLGGELIIDFQGKLETIKLNRIHIEEDAGKLNHDIITHNTAVDYNRAGTPLIEIVTEPCISNSTLAALTVQEVKKIVTWYNISKGDMEDGCLRCDANVSVRLKGEKKLGTKVEIKNLNSFKNIKNSLDYEIDRLSQLLDKNGSIIKQTRGYDAQLNKTFTLREKEDEQDYRYFSEPDLAPLIVSEEDIIKIKNEIGLSQKWYLQEFSQCNELNNYDLSQLTDNKIIAEFFYKLIKTISQDRIKLAANLTLLHFKEWIQKVDFEIFTLDNNWKIFNEIIDLIYQNKIHLNKVDDFFLNAVFIDSKNLYEYCDQLNLWQNSNKEELANWCKELLLEFPVKCKEYQSGKKGLIDFFIGQLKRKTKGQADSNIAKNILIELLKK